jgi:hypothetical protein
MIPRTFIGIRRFLSERPSTLVETEVCYETTINNLVDKLIVLDKRLDVKSADSYRIYSENIENQLLDQRVKTVRMAFESKVF